ncbi:MAG: hypothetical protein GY757_17145 [bacterium]|nr:hypothetical protein [bacterium]
MKKDRLLQFAAHMEKLLGKSEAALLMESIEGVSPKSVRYNRSRCQAADLSGPIVPWCSPFGRTWTENVPPSSSIEYAAGGYYIQEAAAMLAISAASQVIDFQGKLVLDLCAAPGGKSTQVAELIGPGYLVANETVRKRVDALMWNINRHRLNNVIITSMTTSRLAAGLPGFFDVVIVDAPCSGEGLFQKRKHSPVKWSAKSVRGCARRQESILRGAAALVRPGGIIVYSTCTFSKEENEEQIEILLNNGFSPVVLPDSLPVSGAISENENICSCSRRIFPHREGGAGAFLGVVQKEPAQDVPFLGEYESFKYKYPDSKIKSFPFELKGAPGGYFFERAGVISYFSFEQLPKILCEMSIQTGAPIFDRRRGNNIMYGIVQLASHGTIININREDALSYTSGDDLNLDYPNGFCFVAFEGLVLGPVEIIQGKAINKLPAPLMRKR